MSQDASELRALLRQGSDIVADIERTLSLGNEGTTFVHIQDVMDWHAAALRVLAQRDFGDTTKYERLGNPQDYVSGDLARARTRIIAVMAALESQQTGPEHPQTAIPSEDAEKTPGTPQWIGVIEQTVAFFRNHPLKGVVYSVVFVGVAVFLAWVTDLSKAPAIKPVSQGSRFVVSGISLDRSTFSANGTLWGLDDVSLRVSVFNENSEDIAVSEAQLLFWSTNGFYGWNPFSISSEMPQLPSQSFRPVTVSRMGSTILTIRARADPPSMYEGGIAVETVLGHEWRVVPVAVRLKSIHSSGRTFETLRNVGSLTVGVPNWDENQMQRVVTAEASERVFEVLSNFQEGRPVVDGKRSKDLR